MLTKKDRNLELAHVVFAWNQRHLNKDATWTDEQLCECFEEQFVVEPNGRRYDATLSTYKEFLDDMRNTMTGIQYQVQHAVADDALWCSRCKSPSARPMAPRNATPPCC